MPQVAAIIQARMSSKRLPGKVLREVMGKPLLGYLVERLKPSREINQLALATSIEPSDRPIVDWCASEGVPCFQGSLDDVLDRFYQCANQFNPKPDTIVRLTGDCPLNYFGVVDFSVSEYKKSGADYFSNVTPNVGEDGFDVEVFSYQVLKGAWQNREQASEMEHVTSSIRSNPNLKCVFRKYRPEYRLKLSVDDNKEFNLTRFILEQLYTQNPLFTIDDVIELLNQSQSVSA